MAENHKQQNPDGFFDIFTVAELPSTHPGAYVERGGKAIQTSSEQGFLCYGQYKQGYPIMPLQAVFSILIGDNTKDDRNVLIVDVYDHHSDRVIGKRVLTRRDFAKANEFCLFTFDFIPPSLDANMEFRIYYMGHAYILADKIAVIDPAKIATIDSSQTLLTKIPETKPELQDNGIFDIFRVAELPSTHPGAFVELGGKAIRTTTEQGFLCYGQYKQGYPLMPLQAVFSILIDDNSSDDRNILILDVYDHHSDRVLGKRVLTRRDFAKAKEFCLFTFDFIPPSQQANMEFRIYYMGHAYVLADKIAVIDPSKIVAIHPAQTPVTNISEVVEESELPEPWKIKRIGNGDGNVSHYEIRWADVNSQKQEVDYNGVFTLEATGTIQDHRDDFFFLYQKWSKFSGNGKVVAKFSHQEGFVGVMFRETLESDSRFIMLEKQNIVYRETPGGKIIKKAIEPPSFLKLVRKGQGAKQYYTGYGGEDLPFELPAEVYAGLALGTSNVTVEVGIQYKVLKGFFESEGGA